MENLEKFLPAIDKLLKFYHDKEACNLKRARKLSDTYMEGNGWKCMNIDTGGVEAEDCPLCETAKGECGGVNCARCPWILIENESCIGPSNPLMKETRTDRIKRLLRWKALILDQKKGELNG